tara:strand:- start:142 stop:1404 length:1263 start_codon:yes stop_codon:yes gene_type:complete
MRVYNLILGSSTILLDIRSREDYNSGHIQGALHIRLPPLEDIQQDFNWDSLISNRKDQGKWAMRKRSTIAVYDEGLSGGGGEALALAELLGESAQCMAVGYLSGGMKAWRVRYPFLVLQHLPPVPLALAARFSALSFTQREVEFYGAKVLLAGAKTFDQLKEICVTNEDGKVDEACRKRLVDILCPLCDEHVETILSAFCPPEVVQETVDSVPSGPPPPPPPPPEKIVAKKKAFALVDVESSHEELLMEATRTHVYPSEVVEDFLFLGGLQCAEDREVLRRLNITRILNMTSEHVNPFLDDPDLTYCHLPIDDSPDKDISSLFESGFNFLKDSKAAGTKVLVHCAMGISRSATITIYFLMREHRWTLKQAFECVYDERPFINPNKGFIQQLLQFEKTIGASPPTVVEFQERRTPIFKCEE